MREVAQVGSGGEAEGGEESGGGEAVEVKTERRGKEERDKSGGRRGGGDREKQARKKFREKQARKKFRRTCPGIFATVTSTVDSRPAAQHVMRGSESGRWERQRRGGRRGRETRQGEGRSFSSRPGPSPLLLILYPNVVWKTPAPRSITCSTTPGFFFPPSSSRCTG
eukprot:750827-Hanusia_phi.AAC.3